jgi:hypothetical protein
MNEQSYFGLGERMICFLKAQPKKMRGGYDRGKLKTINPPELETNLNIDTNMVMRPSPSYNAFKGRMSS